VFPSRVVRQSIGMKKAEHMLDFVRVTLHSQCSARWFDAIDGILQLVLLFLDDPVRSTKKADHYAPRRSGVTSKAEGKVIISRWPFPTAFHVLNSIIPFSLSSASIPMPLSLVAFTLVVLYPTRRQCSALRVSSTLICFLHSLSKLDCVSQILKRLACLRMGFH
jgi:hypothetical protein